MKKVLVIYYTQSGQLLEIARNVVSSLENSNDISVSYYQIKTDPRFDFPWESTNFFNAFPESFLQLPSKLSPSHEGLLQAKYDLIILAYQVWYLTPSIPVNSFLKSNKAKILNDTPVITVIGCRNMWVMAHEKVKKLLKNANARLVGNIVLEDKHLNHISVITIAQWMFSGKKERYLGIFPKPGVSQQDIDSSKRFGKPILDALIKDSFDTLQKELLKMKAVTIKPFLVLADKRANILFGKWANFIIKKGETRSPQRLFWIRIFKFYLLFAIWVIAPIFFIVFLLTYLPFYGKIKREKKYYSAVGLKY